MFCDTSRSLYVVGMTWEENVHPHFTVLPQRHSTNSSACVRENDVGSLRDSLHFLHFLWGWHYPDVLCGVEDRTGRPSAALSGLWCGDTDHKPHPSSLGAKPYLFPIKKTAKQNRMLTLVSVGRVPVVKVPLIRKYKIVHSSVLLVMKQQQQKECIFLTNTKSFDRYVLEIRSENVAPSQHQIACKNLTHTVSTRTAASFTTFKKQLKLYLFHIYLT